MQQTNHLKVSHTGTAHNQHLVLEEEETTADDENLTIGVEL